MKWFRHENTFNNPKITLLKSRHGAVGYGVYFAILELISEHIEPTNTDEWGYLPVTYTKFLEVLAQQLYVDIETLTAVLTTCYEVNLLENKEGRIYCDQILERCDRYTELLIKQKEQKSKDPQHKKEKDDPKKELNSHKKTKSVHKMAEYNQLVSESIPIIEEEENKKENIKEEEQEIIEKKKTENKVPVNTGSVFQTQDDVEILSKKHSNTNYLISLFKPLNPSFEKLYVNKTERKAIEILEYKNDFIWLENLLLQLPDICARPYAPRVTKPTELANKLGHIMQFLQQESRKEGHGQSNIAYVGEPIT